MCRQGEPNCRIQQAEQRERVDVESRTGTDRQTDCYRITALPQPQERFDKEQISGKLAGDEGILVPLSVDDLVRRKRETERAENGQIPTKADAAQEAEK